VGDDADRLHTDLVAAFFHPPKLISCGRRLTDGDGAITIISHVEVWTWRTIIAGSRARNDGVQLSGTKLRESVEWFGGWSIVDDVHTEYRQLGAGSGGDGFCVDFHIKFSSAVPTHATQLVLTTPNGDDIELTL